MRADYFAADISRTVWDSKYRFRDGEVVRDHTIEDTWRRVARALASQEPGDRSMWEGRFYDALEGFKFLPGGRILAGAGTGRRVTLFNCFVMGVIEDSIDGIFDALKEGAVTMQQGGGVGYDFSTLRPQGSRAKGAGTLASGPVSFMRIWDSMCATLLSTGARRGAMMATLRCDHPDIEAYLEAKRDSRELRHFNLSVQISDAFMAAVRADRDWDLVFPAEDLAETLAAIVLRRWPGRAEPTACRVFKRVPARQLWERLMRATYDDAEPGVLFVDRINRANNLAYREYITATNPCGEIPLPPYGACNLGSINVTQFVQYPFSQSAGLDLDGIRAISCIATRMLDNVTDLSRFPLEEQAQQARGSRRIGLGITGLADALIMLGLHYGEERARGVAADVMRTICHAAYETSIALGREKGAFPFFERDRYLAGEFIRMLPAAIRNGITEHGLRNSHVTAIAPTGTISLLANNVSSGLEPVFDFQYSRRVLELDGRYVTHDLTDYAVRLWRELKGNAPLPETFVAVGHLQPKDHLAMQAALQPFVDNAISKTINIPTDYDFASFRSLYEQAYDLGLKGCTTFRPNPVTGVVLEAMKEEGTQTPHCCSVEREAD